MTAKRKRGRAGSGKGGIQMSDGAMRDAAAVSKKIALTFPRAPIPWYACVLIICVGLAVYASAIGGQFVYDDSRLVSKNIYVTSWKHLADIWTRDICSGAGSAIYQSNFFRPVQMTTYLIDHTLWGRSSAGYHLTNILLHIVVALCLYRMAFLLFQEQVSALFASLLFLVHPIHTQAVAYISGRADLLSGLGIVSCLVFYIQYIRSSDRRRLIYATACFVGALLSKEYALITLILILLHNLIYNRKKIFDGLAPLAVAGVIYLVVRSFVLGASQQGVVTTTFAERIPGFFVALGQYMRLIVFPFGLHMEYGAPLFCLLDMRVLAGIVALAGFVYTSFSCRKRYPLVSFSACWFLIAILPVSNIFPINAYMAESWLYIPSIGVFLIAGRALGLLYNDARHKQVALRTATAAILYFSILTIVQNQYWKDPQTLYEETLKRGGRSVRILSNLGSVYLDKGEAAKAIEFYKLALEEKKDPAGVYNNLGLAYSMLGREREAIEAYRNAIASRPDFAEAFNNLGNSYAAIGSKADAIISYRRAIELNPRYAEAYNNLATELPPGEEAIDMYRKAIEIRPDYADAYTNLINMLGASGRPEEAARYRARSSR